MDEPSWRGELPAGYYHGDTTSTRIIGIRSLSFVVQPVFVSPLILSGILFVALSFSF